MLIGQKLRDIRESKNLSQGDIEERTGLRRSYTSRVENGHNVPSVETLEKYARALEMPLYQLFYDGESPIKKPTLPEPHNGDAPWGADGKENRELRIFIDALSRMDDRNRKLFFAMAQRLAHRGKKR